MKIKNGMEQAHANFTTERNVVFRIRHRTLERRNKNGCKKFCSVFAGNISRIEVDRFLDELALVRNFSGGYHIMKIKNGMEQAHANFTTEQQTTENGRS